MLKNYFKWLDGGMFQYAASLAATWIWAPSLLVSALQAHTNGMPGFLMFAVPDFFMLVIFGFIVKYVRDHIVDDGYTMVDAIKSADKRQRILHICMSFILLLLSTCCQIVGIHTAISFIIDNKIVSSLLVSAFSLLLVWKHGLKGSIITDVYKYCILVVCALLLILLAEPNPLNFVGVSGLSVSEIWWTFGLTCTLGLLSAPYIDNTFWQRGFSMPKEKIVPTFIFSAFLFILVPIAFGYMGFINAFSYSGVSKILMLIATICALISTLDSNLIAIAGYTTKVFGKSIYVSRAAMIGVLLAACAVFSFDIFDITKLFLSYNTVRCCMVLPTLFIIFDCYNRKRLFWCSLLASLVCPIMYILTSNPIYTVGALVVTAIGYKSKNILRR